jgi:hypothetical protein
MNFLNRQFQLSTIFYLDKKDEIYHYSSKELKSILKLVKLQSLVAKCCKTRKI